MALRTQNITMYLGKYYLSMKLIWNSNFVGGRIVNRCYYPFIAYAFNVSNVSYVLSLPTLVSNFTIFDGFSLLY